MAAVIRQALANELQGGAALRAPRSAGDSVSPSRPLPQVRVISGPLQACRPPAEILSSR